MHAACFSNCACIRDHPPAPPSPAPHESWNASLCFLQDRDSTCRLLRDPSVSAPPHPQKKQGHGGRRVAEAQPPQPRPAVRRALPRGDGRHCLRRCYTSWPPRLSRPSPPRRSRRTEPLPDAMGAVVERVHGTGTVPTVGSVTDVGVAAAGAGAPPLGRAARRPGHLPRGVMASPSAATAAAAVTTLRPTIAAGGGLLLVVLPPLSKSPTWIAPFESLLPP